jgi:hypothetical protein
MDNLCHHLAKLSRHELMTEQSELKCTLLIEESNSACRSRGKTEKADPW